MARKRGRSKLFTLTDMCRGNGKIYAVVEPAPEMLGLRFDASCETASGHPLPAKILHWQQFDRCVLVLPIVGVTQRCTIIAYAEDGAECARETHVVNHHAAHVRSAANRFRKNEAIRRICDCDDWRGGNACEVRINRIVSGGTRPGLVVHGCVTCIGTDREAVGGGIELRFLGYDGVDASVTPWINLRDEVSAHADYPGVYMRSLQYSVRVGEGAQGLTVWALPSNEDIKPGFHTLDEQGFAGKVNAWLTDTQIASGAQNYDSWFRAVHAVGTAEAAIQAQVVFPYEPKFSIIVPLYRTPPLFFKEMVDSVLRQSYANFELVLVNGSPDDGELSALVDECVAADARIVKVNLEENRGITENTNAGIAVATGDFLCFLDHDDVITDDALFCYARALNEYPDTDLLYSDEDIVDQTGSTYFGPYFKPDWNPDLLLGMNYICHFMCVRKSIVDEFEPASREFDGSQDHHMALRVSERARNIYHERRILYHWRSHPASTAGSSDAKPYALEAGIRAVQSHLDRCGVKGKAVFSDRLPCRYEVNYEIEGMPLISILIPTKDNVEMLDRCVRSVVEKSSYGNFEIILIENNSENEATFEYYEKARGRDERIRVVKFEGPFNYSAVNNFGASAARGDYLLLLNNDTEVITENWLERMLALCMRENTGVVGAKLLYPDGTIQHCGVISTESGPNHLNLFRDDGDRGYADNTEVRQDIAAVTGACLMTKRSLYDRIGGFDEQMPVSYNDVDYCYSVWKAGYLVVIDPGTKLFHYESVSRGYDETAERQLRLSHDRALLMAKWPERFAFPDASSNPNLSRTSKYCQAAF